MYCAIHAIASRLFRQDRTARPLGREAETESQPTPATNAVLKSDTARPSPRWACSRAVSGALGAGCGLPSTERVGVRRGVRGGFRMRQLSAQCPIGKLLKGDSEGGATLWRAVLRIAVPRLAKLRKELTFRFIPRTHVSIHVQAYGYSLCNSSMIKRGWNHLNWGVSASPQQLPSLALGRLDPRPAGRNARRQNPNSSVMPGGVPGQRFGVCTLSVRSL